MKLFSTSRLAWLIFVVLLVAFGVAVQPMVHSGEPTNMLSQKLGVYPLEVFSAPVYGWIVQGIAAVGGTSVFYAVNLFSAFCAAALGAIVFLLIYHSTRPLNIDHSFSSRTMHRVQIAAGLIGVLYLLANESYWMAATRALPMTFDLLLMLSAFLLVLTYMAKDAPAKLYLAVTLYGVTIVQFTSAILFAPIFVILVLVKLWAAGLFSVRQLVTLTLYGLAGLSLYLVQAGLFMASPAYEWREFSNYFQIIWYIWLEQYQNLTSGLPRQGWLTLSFVSFLPWIITSSFRLPGSSNRVRGALFGTSAVYFILGVLAVLLLMDFPLAPRNLTGGHRLFLTPYLVIALWVGNVAVYWMVLLFREKRFENPVSQKARRFLGYGVAAGFPIYLVFIITTVSIPSTRSNLDVLINEFTNIILDQSSDREWLVTNTPFDEQVGLEAFRQAIPLKVFNLAHGRSPVLMKYVAALFSHDPRLQSLAGVGMSPLLDEWFMRDENIADKAVVVHVADMWLAAGFEAVPDRAVFYGVRNASDINLDGLMEANRTFWAGYGSRVIEVDIPKNGRNAGLVEWIRVHLSKLANNLGVFMEDRNRTDDALACYKQALEFAPENLSALMNYYVIADREKLPEAGELEAKVIERTDNLGGRVHTISLSYIYGYVRVPELFVNRGMSFAMSGKADLAIADLKRALALRENNPQLQMALASLYFGQEKDEQSAEYYQNVLRGNPNNQGALLGMMRVATRQGDYAEARNYLRQLRELGVNPAALNMEEAVLESLSGSPTLALKLLRDAVKLQPDNMRAWAALAILAAEQNDQRTADEAVAKLRQARALAPALQMVMAQSALNKGERDVARQHIDEVLRRQPGNIQALEMLLRINMFEGSRDQVQKTAERILGYNPRNALANYMLGVHHYYKEEYALAESAYRVSLSSQRSPEALNDLAFILYLQNRLPEAEPLIRESLEINNRNSQAWDTLGVILLAKNELASAEVALLKSLEIRPEAASVMLSLGLLYEKQGRFDEASTITRSINARMNELSPQAQASLRQLNQRLRDVR
ncbi:MAG TPA: tetratricopeptide repeat protein [Kiritimatiellia bacterium]|nr:tetratricopeptide repeat protein [Kiritimatiellia bacterium]